VPTGEAGVLRDRLARRGRYQTHRDRRAVRVIASDAPSPPRCRPGTARTSQGRVVPSAGRLRLAHGRNAHGVRWRRDHRATVEHWCVSEDRMDRYVHAPGCRARFGAAVGLPTASIDVVLDGRPARPTTAARPAARRVHGGGRNSQRGRSRLAGGGPWLLDGAERDAAEPADDHVPVGSPSAPLNSALT
jgi:hypothetical protein